MSLESNLNRDVIYALPDEIWDRIFSYLDIEERVRLERVCSRWRAMAKNHPKWGKPKRLLFNATRLHRTWLRPGTRLTDAVLEEILSRCGAVLKDLELVNSTTSFSGYKIDVTSECVRLISKHCGNLQKIELMGFPLSRILIKGLAHGCPHLTTVVLSDYSNWNRRISSSEDDDSDATPSDYATSKKKYIQSDYITVLTKGCPKLNSLTLQLNYSVVGRDLDFTNVELRMLCVRCLDEWSHYCAFPITNVKLSSNLEELRLNPCPVPSELLMKLLKTCGNSLKVLDVRDTTTYTSFLAHDSDHGRGGVNWCKVLGKLPKLEELRMDAVLRAESPCCHAGTPHLSRRNLSLRILQVNFKQAQTPRFLEKLMMACSAIEELQLHYFQFKPTILKMAALKYVNTMKTLVIWEGSFAGCTDWVEDLLAAMKNVETARLRLDKVDDDVVRLIASSCSKIRTLDLTGTSVTDDGLVCLSSLPNLISLNVSFTGYISDYGLKVVASAGRLEELYAEPSAGHDSDDFTDEGCVAFANLCPNFRVLHVDFRKYVTNNLVDAFCRSILRGFMKNRVTLFVGNTSVIRPHAIHKRLEVLLHAGWQHDAALGTVEGLNRDVIHF